MKTKKLVLGFTFVLAAAFIAPVVAYMSNEPGTIIDIKDFRGNTFETALLSDEPGTVIDIKDFRGNTFETALMTDEPGTVI
ncbi:MAG: hypothetical protein JW765_13710, partial [Deltaproteobacteria bacterium]|nr:hypothetical protein [Candidatus Zymogenaceae bacterium]